MKKLWISMIVLGSALAAFGFSGFDADLSSNTFRGLDGTAGWDTTSRIEMTAGAVLLALGILLFKDSNYGKSDPNA
jgi:hypothetical protein